MELTTLKDAFDRVSKKQKLSSSLNQELINLVGNELEQAIEKIQSASADPDSSTLRSILRELSDKFNQISPLNQLEASQKELNIGLSKFVKSLEKTFIPDISKAYGNMNFDIHTLNQILASHFYRQGLFDLGDSFLQEAGEVASATAAAAAATAALKSPFLSMHNIVETMRGRDLGPALEWATAQSARLTADGSCLELKLHRLKFLDILHRGDKNEALRYARTHLAPFAALHRLEIQKLMACLLWAGRLDQSPYAEFMSPTQWEKMAEEVAQQFCRLLGQPRESPLGVVAAAGAQGLPTLLKLAGVVAAKKQEWQSMKQLPVPLELGRDLQFHSIFVCPVLREQASDENPPLLMPCGHVLSKQSVVKLSKNSTRAFKCPYCPSEATFPQCKQLHF